MGKGWLIVALLASGAASLANAQVIGPDCARLTDDAKRLHCYDAIFRTKTSESVKGAWQITEEVSKIDDSKNVFATVESTEPVRGPYGQRGKAVLFVRCVEKKTSLYLTFADHFMSSTEAYGTITYRIDRNPAQKRRFVESTDHKALGLWSASDAIPFIRQLYSGNTLFVQALPYSQSPVTAEFQIGGTRESLESVQTACGWASAPKPIPPKL